MLELRLRTLRNVVDRTVVVACAVTHQNQPIDRDMVETAFSMAVESAGVNPVTAYLTWCDPEIDWPTGARGGVGTPQYQQIERIHRDFVRDAVSKLTNDPRAVVMVSDVDEIPDVHAIADHQLLLDRMNRGHDWLVCLHRFHSTALNLLHPQQPWLGTGISRLRDLAPQAIRDERGPLFEAGAIVEGPAAVHLSWMGSDEEREWKLNAFSHAELVGKFKPAEARVLLRHANDERLRLLSTQEMLDLPWPRPITDGTFVVPESWWA